MLTTPDPSLASQGRLPGRRPNSLNLVALLDRLDEDPTVDPGRRQQWAGAIRSLCSILGQPAESLPASMPELQRRLDAVPAAARGRSRKTVDNIRSHVKAAILHVEAKGSMPPRGAKLTPEWARLAEAIPTPRLSKGLSRLIRVASHHGIAPEAMSDAVLDRLVEIVGTVNWGRDVKPFRQQSVTLWNESVDLVPGWPRVRLTAPEAVARPAHLPLTAFPDSFQDELARYLRWATGEDPLAADAPANPLRAGTITLRRSQLRIAASVLAKHLGGPERVVSLATLTQPPHAKVILSAYVVTRRGARAGPFVIGIAGTLRALARDWVKVPQADLDELKRLARKLGPAPTGMTPKNRTLIRQMDDPRLLHQLLGLPEVLRKQARTERMSPGRRLQKVQIALAIDILFVIPLRLANLAGLELDRHLQWPSGPTGKAYIVFQSGEIKNETPIEFEIPPHLRQVLDDYLHGYRVHANPNGSSWLFVRNGKRVADNVLSDGITKAIKRELGIHMTPHQFRHLAAAIALDAHPGALGLVKDLLGHKNYKTTVNSYAGMRTPQAAKEYDRILAARRGEARGA